MAKFNRGVHEAASSRWFGPEPARLPGAQASPRFYPAPWGAATGLAGVSPPRGLPGAVANLNAPGGFGDHRFSPVDAGPEIAEVSGAAAFGGAGIGGAATGFGRHGATAASSDDWMIGGSDEE
jgi:hypothetical protein